MEFMRAGFDVLCSDLDVMWLGDPRPWVAGMAKTGMLLGLADVVVSTDVTHGTLDKDEAAWGINNEMNTGMVLLRSSEGAMVFCRRWQARMEQDMKRRMRERRDDILGPGFHSEPVQKAGEGGPTI